MSVSDMSVTSQVQTCKKPGSAFGWTGVFLAEIKAKLNLQIGLDYF